MKFELINSLQDIKDILSRASSDDGEMLTFELKGTKEEEKFTKDHKKILAKEICAFANTYGGLLCFHFGSDTDIKPFPLGFTEKKFSSIESWLRDSLEPKVLGMDLKIVDNVFVVNVPESKTKPHRTASTRQYYYRHSTISEPMPEIMISSMYRSQEYLSYSSSIVVTKSSKQIFINLHIQNHSNISGSKPKVQIQLFTNMLIEFGQRNYFDKHSKDAFQILPLKQNLKIPISAMIETNSLFAEKILYPKDSIILSNYSEPNDRIHNIRHVLIRVDSMFKETVRQTEYQIIQFDQNNKHTTYMSSSTHNVSDMVNTFSQLIMENV